MPLIVATIIYIVLSRNIGDKALMNKISTWLMHCAIVYQLFRNLRDAEPKRSRSRLLRFFVPYTFIVVYSVVIHFISDDATVEMIAVSAPIVFMCYELYLMRYDNE
jgi:predicted neutral ceramidase superfamily lipid hydrolase